MIEHAQNNIGGRSLAIKTPAADKNNGNIAKTTALYELDTLASAKATAPGKPKTSIMPTNNKSRI